MSNFNLDREKFSRPPSCQALSKHENKLRNLRNASKKHSVEWQRYISHSMRLRKSFTCLQTRYIDERRDIGRMRSTWRPTIIDTGRGTGSDQVVDTFNCKRLSWTSFISSENGCRAAGLWPIYFRYPHYPVILILDDFQEKLVLDPGLGSRQKLVLVAYTIKLCNHTWTCDRDQNFNQISSYFSVCWPGSWWRWRPDPACGWCFDSDHDPHKSPPSTNQRSRIFLISQKSRVVDWQLNLAGQVIDDNLTTTRDPQCDLANQWQHTHTLETNLACQANWPVAPISPRQWPNGRSPPTMSPPPSSSAHTHTHTLVKKNPHPYPYLRILRTYDYIRTQR